MLKYALVCGRLEQYVDGSVVHTVSPYDGETPLVEWTNAFGTHCVCVPEGFIPGEYNELMTIIRERENARKDAVSYAQSRFPQATDIERTLIEYIVEDGYDPDELNYEIIQETVRGTMIYLEFNSSLVEAYMDYMH